MPRQSNTIERRSQIVQGLSAAMAEHGYDGANMHSIARHCGLTTGLLHYHFKSKQEILLALIDSLDATIESRYHARLSNGAETDAYGKLLAFIDAHLALGDDANEQAVACRVMIGSESARNETVRHVYQTTVGKQISRLEEIVAGCLSQDGKSKENKRSLALGIFAAIEGSYGLIVAAPQLIERGFAAPTVFTMSRAAIASQDYDSVS